MKPKPYDFNKKEEIDRWFHEMEGYLRTGYGEHKTFVNMGTDFEGRKFAFEGFFKLKELVLKSFFTSEELEQQFLSKELVLRKLDELQPTGQVESGDQVFEVINMRRINAWKKQVLNECSAKENSLLKKLEGF